MRGILINNTVHTGNDLDLVLTAKNLPTPALQEYVVEVPGRNGALDLSEALCDEPRYNNRTLTFNFFANGSRAYVLELIDKMLAYHGTNITIVTDDHPDWYYQGRAKVEYEDKYYYVNFIMTINAQPFRTALEAKTYEYNNLVAKEIIVENRGVSIIPKIIVDAETTIVYGDTTYTLSAGTYEDEALKLLNGKNTLVVTTTGKFTITYREETI